MKNHQLRQEFLDRWNEALLTLRALILGWAERESVRVKGKGLHYPDHGFVWRQDKLGHWHHGSYAGYHHDTFVPCQAGYDLTRGTSPIPSTRLDEFEVALRSLDEFEQRLVLTAELCGLKSWEGAWEELRADCRLPERALDERLHDALEKIMLACQRRGLLAVRR